jgi:hypothetical protein
VPREAIKKVSGCTPMIQRDYILRMIEEFMQFLSRLQSLRRGQLWEEAAAALDDEFRRSAAGASAGA